MDSCHRLVSNIWLLCGRRDGIVHFMTYWVLENCLEFMQTNRLCNAERIAMLESLDCVYGGGRLRCCFAVAVRYVDV